MINEESNRNGEPRSIRVACPTGHQLRGDSTMIGKTISCPKCKERFVFQSDKVTDTGVMRILGDAPSLENTDNQHMNSETRPCPRCSTSIAATAMVCRHCDCYVGSLPDFLTSEIAK